MTADPLNHPVPPRVLLVDDEEMIRENLSAYFEDEGFDVVTSPSGEKAIDILSQGKMDVAIFDLRLPGINGNALLLKALELQPDLEVMVYTGSYDYSPPEELRSLRVVPERVFHKPIEDMAILADCIRRLAKERSERQ